ncbi:hypothetical protein DL93DRAFT_2087279 [Clavulina sp. PMI_390]|nr:hypothetical protein DL93DRAFT_2087279 [Clavulina sp. PMI_390]
MAPEISVEGSVSKIMREQATRFCTLIGDIGDFFHWEPERLEEELILRSESVHLQRALSFGARPGSQAQASLAQSLRNFSIPLHKIGLSTQACILDEEALAIRRECYRARPGEQRPYLADVLDGYSRHLHVTGRRDEALEAAEEAIKYWRLLYEFNPDEYSVKLAGALQELGIGLSSMQRLEECKAAEEEALMLWRSLYREEPERYRSSLVNSLTNHIITMKDLGLQDESRTLYAEFCELHALMG